MLAVFVSSLGKKGKMKKQFKKLLDATREKCNDLWWIDSCPLCIVLQAYPDYY